VHCTPSATGNIVAASQYSVDASHVRALQLYRWPSGATASEPTAAVGAIVPSSKPSGSSTGPRAE
jgi:hypothetical protein